MAKCFMCISNVTKVKVVLLVALVCHRCPVSFYGESYIHIPLHDAFHEASLELRFKTPRPYGVLFLITGTADFFLLQLRSGTLEVQIHVGSKDTVLELGKGRYDDLEWHSVEVTTEDGTVVLTVDNTTTVRGEKTDEFSTLNIDSGVFLGGVDSQTNSLFGDELRNFRGCLSNIYFNSRDLLLLATSIEDPGSIVEISWDFDEIFEPIRDRPIFFSSETSFASFSHLHPGYERTVSFVMKTTTRTALLLFSFTRHSSGHAFYALEVLNGFLKLTVCEGDEKVSVEHLESPVSDGKWHQIDVGITASQIELVVDGTRDVSEFTDKKGVTFGGLVYVGGVSHKARAVGLHEGLASLDGENSMKGAIIGCVKSVVLNSRAFDIRDIHVSRLIGVSCDDTDCKSGNCEKKGSLPCVDGQCLSDDTAAMLPVADSTSDGPQILSVNPITVREGERALISKDNIEIVYDFRQLRIRESAILIYIVRQPRFGDIEVNLGRRKDNIVFTYLDLIGKKVSYVNEGSEEVYDDIRMEIEVDTRSSTEDSIPANLRQRYEFVLPIQIVPINDPPSIMLGNEGILRIIENTKIRITSDILSADDPDTRPGQLKYIIIDPPSQGYFEKVGQIGAPVLEFTQQEINERQIWFLHLGSGNSFVRLKLSDGLASSDPAELNIQTVQLRLTVNKNSGLVMPQGGLRVITSANLSTSSNVPTQELEIRYEIVRNPRHGVIERQQYADGEWHEVRSFAQRHVNNGHIRYRQTDMTTSSNADQFSFTVKAKSSTTPFYTFRIQFEQIYIILENANKLVLFQQSFGVISNNELLAKTNNPIQNSNSIRYTVIRPPSFGDIIKIDQRHRGVIDFSRFRPLRKGSTFLQADIDDETIYYNLKSDTFEKVQDFTDLRLHTTGSSDKIIRFLIDYIPMKSDVRFINTGLDNVIEGGLKAIDRRNLYIQTDSYSIFEFTVLSQPKHGDLQLVDPRSSVVQESNVSEFTNDDIKNLRLVYHHDDSEAQKDSFSFMAVPVIQRPNPTDSEVPEFPGTFEINMQMRNDNPPQRLVNKVFNVVREKERIITIDDLAFTDPDIDYDDGELEYTRQVISNGEIIHAISRSQIYKFKQRDIRNKLIVFKHHGEDRSRAAIYVSDGQYDSPSLFEIEAGEPYVEITINTGATVRNNGKVYITNQNLSVETNVNVNDENIRFVLIQEPRLGNLVVFGQEVIEFDLDDIKQGKLMYKHEGRANSEDSFKFAVVAKDAQIQGSFSIQIFMESSERPPRIVNNKALIVFGSERGTIDQSNLLVTHPASLAEDIEYLILVLPKYGKLYRNNVTLTMEDMTFTQLDINRGYLSYEVLNSSATTDQFIFEVTNGFQTLRGLEFLCHITSSSLPLEVYNFTVEEGGEEILTTQHMKIKGRFYQDKAYRFEILRQPIYGSIVLSDAKDVPVSSFTSDDLKQERVLYVHDDSDSLTDDFSLQAMLLDGSKKSEVRTVYVTINGRNDESPRIVTNKGITVWKGSMTQITANHLRAVDPDNGPNELQYRISTPTNGHVSLLNNTFKAIASFRQSWIDDGLIVFVHSGANNGSFSLQVTDGINSGELQTFHTYAKPLILTLDANQLLNAYPNKVQLITATHLSGSTNDPEQSKPIIFTLTSKPVHGSVVTMVQGRPLEVTSFTQAEINSGEIYYKHNDKLQGWTQNDTYNFRVNTLYADPITEQSFEIYISYGNLNAENKNLLIKTADIVLDEGGEMIVAKNNLDVTQFVRNLERLGKRVSLRFSLRDRPFHGTILYSGKKLSKQSRFSQRNVNAHQLIYKHDDSETVSDTFNLTLHLRIQDKSLDGNDDEESQFLVTLNVRIQPVNDEEMKLVTKNPNIDITQGFWRVIDRSVLLTVDADTLPAHLMYTIFRDPDNGFITYKEKPSVPIHAFTQQDVDDNRVLFKHDGSTRSGTFQFKVTDGMFGPYFYVFNIHVVPVTMSIAQNATIQIIQSEFAVLVTQKNLNVSTNGMRENVSYVITKQPMFGKVYVQDREVSSFTQSDIDKTTVIYMQTNLKSGFDEFICDVAYTGTNIKYTDRWVTIKVEPFVEVGPIEAPAGERIAITLLSLDASKLSEVTGSNPVYNIKSGPFFGRIIKRSYTKRQVYKENYRRDSGFRETRQFSHEDVVYTKVFYERFGEAHHNTGKDNFTYNLEAFSVQPAEGVFYIGLSQNDFGARPPIAATTSAVGVTERKTTTFSTHNGDDRSAKNDESLQPRNAKSDHVILLAILIPVVLLIVVAIVTILLICRVRRKRDYNRTKKAPRMRPNISGPLQIDQPHVLIEPSEQQLSPTEETSSSAEYQNTGNIPGVSGVRAHSEEADVVTPMIRHDAQQVPRSPDVSRTEVSYMVPYCKVTPMVDNDPSPDDSRKSADSLTEMFDWITSDPELLRHCRATPPALRKKSYWV